MPIIYLSPSTQENNLYVNGGTEEEWMNRLADASKTSAMALNFFIKPCPYGGALFYLASIAAAKARASARSVPSGWDRAWS